MVKNALFNYLTGYEAKRKRLLKKAPEGALKDFLSVPFPDLSTPINQLPILALDFETTGLDAKADKLLSVGFVAMEQEQIKLNTCYHQIIKTKEAMICVNALQTHGRRIDNGFIRHGTRRLMSMNNLYLFANHNPSKQR